MDFKKTAITFIVTVIALSIVALAGYWSGLNNGRADSKKPDSYIVDTSSLDRIVSIARSGLIEQRNTLFRERSEFEAERERARTEIANERKRLQRERDLDIAERERIITERQGYEDIERFCKDTIRIIEERATNKQD